MKTNILSSGVFPSRLLLGAVLVLGLAGAAQAAVMVQYDFESPIDEPKNVSPLVTATNFTAVGAGSILGGASVGTNVNTGTIVGGTTSTGTTAGAQRTFTFPEGASSAATVSRANYLTFTLTPASAIELETISFDFAVNGPGTRGYVLEYSFDNFTTPLALGSGSGTTGNAFTRMTFNLANQNQVTNLTSSPVAFRFYGYSDGAGGVRFDNIQVNAVPEPSVALLGALGALALLRRRR